MPKFQGQLNKGSKDALAGQQQLHVVATDLCLELDLVGILLQALLKPTLSMPALHTANVIRVNWLPRGVGERLLRSLAP